MTTPDRDNLPSQYRIVRNIGRGGTADIYLAVREGSARPVALKLFFEPSASPLAEKELSLGRRLNFPGFVRMFSSGKLANGRPYLDMEYCDGPTLENMAGKISEEKLLSLLSAIAASLDVLHTAGLLHNDLKPSNIFAATGFEAADFPHKQLFYVKVADLSLAREIKLQLGDQATGTVGFMSPEMVLKKELTPASDLFSLGVIAYYLACGRMPFTSATSDPLEINAEITQGKRPELTGPGESFSPPFRDLIASLLAIDPQDRPKSAFLLLEQLARVGSPYPFRKAVRPRHLLGTVEQCDGAMLRQIFGEKSFSDQQLAYVERCCRYDRLHLRLLLEHNFDLGRFARLDGHWGWKTEAADQIEWSHRNSRLALRSLARTPLTFKQYLMAMAVIDDDASVAIKDFSARREDWNFLDAIRLRLRVILLVAHFGGRISLEHLAAEVAA